MVSVSCMAYNHEKYIRKCLGSLVNQKVNFSYEILVHDDASTDHTQSIIKEYEKKYPNLIKPIYQTENQYSKGKPLNINIQRAKGKYVAICEGDDYWTSPEKLQKQVDFLESHNDYSICGHAAYYAKENGSINEKDLFAYAKQSCTIPIEDVIGKWCFSTNSIMYRRALRPLEIPYRKNCKNGDYALTTFLAFKGKVYYMKEAMSAYRVNSIGSLNDRWRKNPDLRKKDRLEYINMLHRMDEYTNQKYHNIIDAYARKVAFDLYCSLGDFENMKKYPDHYASLSALKKLRIYVKKRSPRFYETVKKIVKGY